MVKFVLISSLVIAVSVPLQTYAFVPSTPLTVSPRAIEKSNTKDGVNRYRSTIAFSTAKNVERRGEKKRKQSLKKKQTMKPVDFNTVKIIISGAPASGKGTQCEKIKENFGVVHLSTGDMLRAAVAAETEVGKAAKEFMDSGKLVPDNVIIGIVKDRLDEEDCKSKGWLLDGFPRTRAQADSLASAGVRADRFLFLNVPDEILVERVVGRRTDPVTGKIYHLTFSPPETDEVAARLEQRSDDTEEKVKVRLEQFRSNVAAVKGCYTNISVDIDGTGTPDDVAAAVGKALKETCEEKDVVVV